ncbi:MAG: glucose-6-phosphate isomerase, partial [Planctomycetes bacterium]|nr:glucose-6-phosphate isomerase [Planctomycetota bacterium]
DDPQASYLGGRSLEELIHAEQAGTAVALTDAGRPNATISLAGVNAASIGALLYLFEMQTVFAGRLYRVDPFDQPGVEAGKVAAFALMGRAGHEARAAEIRRRTAESDPNWTLTL